MFDRVKTSRVIVAVLIGAVAAVSLAIIVDQATLRRDPNARPQRTTTVNFRENGSDDGIAHNAGQADLISIVSCASSGCHGQAGKATQGDWRTSYNVWATRDPHAGAYRTLWTEQSTNILRWVFMAEQNLHADDFDNHQAAFDAARMTLIENRCVACHGTAAKQDTGQQILFSHGVNCQSCHGAAEKWQDLHVGKGWEDNKSTDEKSDLGFVELKDLNIRARTCVKCHVGDANRDVNHDLIAAGHPRLFFDFAFYMERLPKHWSVQDDPKALWEIGQLETAKAAIGLLKRRAANPLWPEFAEFDCLECHHGLARDWFQRIYEPNSNLGELTWGSWYVPHHVWPSKSKTDEQGPAAMTWTQPLHDLRAEMARRHPQPDVVIGLCGQIDTSLTQPDMWETLEREPKFDWDSLAHWYFAARASFKELEDQDGSADLTELKRLLINLGTWLNVPFDDSVTEPAGGEANHFDRESLKRLILSIQNELRSKAAK